MRTAILLKPSHSFHLYSGLSPDSIWIELLLTVLYVFSIRGTFSQYSRRAPPFSFSFDPQILPHHFMKFFSTDLSKILTIPLFTIYLHDYFLKRRKRGRSFQFKKSKVTYQNLHCGWKGWLLYVVRCVGFVNVYTQLSIAASALEL